MRIPVLISLLALMAAGSLNSLTAALPPIKLSGGLSGFPLHFGPWAGRTERLDPRIVSQSGAEQAFNGSYRSRTGEIVSLYIGYRGSPFIENENFFHSPSVCLPSLGWRTEVSTDHRITGIPVFGHITVRKMVIEKMGLRQLVYYWFQTKSKVSPNVHINRFHLAQHALSRDNTYDLFIRPITPLQPGEAIGSAERRLDQFVRTMMAELLLFLKHHHQPAHRG
jgi:EpsI family protein